MKTHRMDTYTSVLIILFLQVTKCPSEYSDGHFVMTSDVTYKLFTVLTRLPSDRAV